MTEKLNQKVEKVCESAAKNIKSIKSSKSKHSELDTSDMPMAYTVDSSSESEQRIDVDEIEDKVDAETIRVA